MAVMSWSFIAILLILPCSSFSPSLILLFDSRSAVTNRRASSSFCSFVSTKNNNDDDDEDDFRRRMELVRSLQSSFYASGPADISTIPKLDVQTGILHRLPLWRVQWTELPGRSNVLNVHEGIYTNLFETILSGPPPWYVGHLYLPGGSQNLKSNDAKYQLKTWQEEIHHDDNNNKDRRLQNEPRSAVVGTLLRIVDVRRLTDGRLILLVHALERFVVVRVLQALPYSVADVQILPDEEELRQFLRNDTAASRESLAQAVMRSFQYHPYEYDGSVSLPLPEKDKYLSVVDVFGPSLGKVLPFVPYSSSLEDLKEIEVQTMGSDEERDTLPDGGADEDIPLVKQLVEGGILREPPSHPEIMLQRAKLTLDQVEDQLWTAMEDFCRATGLVLRPEVLCLLPPHRSWPEALSSTTDGTVTPRLSHKYPSLRRQRRLSFAASAFLEHTNVGADLRQMWLETPDTKSRLCAVLERYQMINEMLLGEFQ